MPVTSPSESRALALRVLASEADAIRRTAARLDAGFDHAVDLVLGSSGKVIFSGIGKSGLVAHKIAATMASTGVDAIAVHPVDALHGDIGVVRPGEVVVALSASGRTEELLTFVYVAKERSTSIIAITREASSPLARAAECVLVADAPNDDGILGVLPTGSTLAAIALGDALAIATMGRRGITLDDLEQNHPGGAIGAALTIRVAELQHPLDSCAVVSPWDPMCEVVVRMTAAPLGAALVLDGGALAGIVTDGDLRRGLQDDPAAFMAAPVSEHMTRTPQVVAAGERALEALRLMEEGLQVYVLPVLDADGRCTGLLRMHDLVQRGLAGSGGMV